MFCVTGDTIGRCVGEAEGNTVGGAEGMTFTMLQLLVCMALCNKAAVSVLCGF